MFYITIRSLLFGLFMAWMAWGDRKYEPSALIAVSVIPPAY
jgi:hypothetical protein